MSNEANAPLTVVEILDGRIEEHKKALAIARERSAAFARTATQIEGALLELGTLRKRFGPPAEQKPEPPAPAPE